MLGLSDRVQLFASTFLSQGVRMASTVVLGRFVTESDYGRYLLVLSAAGVIGSLGDFGVYRVVTSRQDLPYDDARDAATAITIALYSLYTVIAVVAGFYFASLYHDSRLVWVGFIQGVTTIATGYYGLQVAAMARHLEFAPWAKLELLLAALSCVTAIALALMGAGLFALVVPPCVAQVTTLLLAPRAVAVRWPRHLRWDLIKEFAHFGWKSSVFQYVNNVQGNIANLAIGGINAPGITGKIERAEAVGVYGRATQVRNLFGHNLVLAIDKVLYPLLCRDQNDSIKFNEMFVRGTSYLFALSGFGAIGFLVTAPDLIRVMLGSRWDEVPPLLRVVSADLFFTAFSVMSLSAAMIMQRPLVACGFSLIQLAFLGPAIWVYREYGPIPFCAVMASSFATSSTLFYAWTTAKLGISLQRVVRRLWPTALVLAVAGLGMALTRSALLSYSPNVRDLLPAFIRLSACGIVGLVLAAAGLFAADRRMYHEILNIFARRRLAVPVNDATRP